jgi:hypothetical protein
MIASTGDGLTLSPAQRKAAQRARERQAGLVTVPATIPDTQEARAALAALVAGLKLTTQAQQR